MRRRFKDPASLVPRHLAAFNAKDWPGDRWTAFEEWRRARMDYCTSTGWPGGPAELIREHVNVRRDLLGIPRIEHVVAEGRAGVEGRSGAPW